MKLSGASMQFAWQSIVLLGMALACGSVHAERADRDKPIHLESDQGTVDDVTQVSTFVGMVLLTQGTMSIHGDKLVVVQDKDGFAHGTATGQPATFRQKREGLDEYVEGYGERIEYDARNEIVDFFGHARMTKSQDEVSGDHITYNSRTEIFHVRGALDPQGNVSNKGRVQVILQPKNKRNSPSFSPLTIQPSDSIASSGVNEHE